MLVVEIWKEKRSEERFSIVERWPLVTVRLNASQAVQAPSINPLVPKGSPFDE